MLNQSKQRCMTNEASIPARSGTYAFILRNGTLVNRQIGRWRQIDFKPGFYIYIGSAFGPGGVRARIRRHCRQNKRVHWHIDYLCECMAPVGAWYSNDPKRLEHRWAALLLDNLCMSPISGFGCTDCSCYTHLFHSSKTLDAKRFSQIVGNEVASWSYRPAL